MNAEPTVAATVDLLGAHLRRLGPLTVTGVLHAVRLRSGWARGELVTYSGGGVTARLPIALPPSTVIADALLSSASVRVSGVFETHPLYGPVQLLAGAVDVIESHTGPDQLVAELTAHGLADRNEALTMPPCPDRVGLIAPLGGGAGGADFLDRIHASGDNQTVLTRYVPMNGPAAASAISGAIVELCAVAVDAIFVCRGGGAASELAVFNHPVVAQAVCRSTRPVVIAVGHATDFTVADVVAHTSLPTPSAAAAWLIDRRRTRQRSALMAAAEARLASAQRSNDETQRARQEVRETLAHAQRERRAALVLAILVLIVLVAVALARWV